MGISTTGILVKKITGFDVSDVIKREIDPNSNNTLKTDTSNSNYVRGGIVFQYTGISHHVFYSMEKDDAEIDDVVYLTMGFSENSVDIMKKIVGFFGGYLLENGSSSFYLDEIDEFKYLYIPKNATKKYIETRKNLASNLNLDDSHEANRIASIILENKDIIKNFI